MNRWTRGCTVTMQDKIGNKKIRETLKIKSLRVRCRQTRLRWFDHLDRRDEQHMITTIIYMEHGSPRKAKGGKAKEKTKNNIGEDRRAVGARREDAQNRKLWNRMLGLAAATPQ